MVDNALNNVYIWYSGPTDITGKRLAEALGTKHGRNKPTSLAGIDVVVGWGAKTSDNVSLPGVKTLNHPDNIRDNRNKYKALTKMKQASVSVAPFMTASQFQSSGLNQEVQLPVIVRTNYHQGGKGFWSCPTRSHIDNAVRDGGQYLQNMIEIQDEFRLHVFGDKAIYSVKKVMRTEEEMKESYIRQELDRLKNVAEKKGKTIDEDSVKFMLESQAIKFAKEGPDMAIRSNKRGWKFSRVTKLPEGLEAEAVKAVKAINLNYGAVDCCIDASGKAFIIEVNTAPGLEGSPLDAWLAAFRAQIAEMTAPPVIETTPAMIWKAPTATASAPAALKPVSTVGSSKMNLSAKLQLIQQMLDGAENEEEVAALSKVIARTFK